MIVYNIMGFGSDRVNPACTYYEFGPGRALDRSPRDDGGVAHQFLAANRSQIFFSNYAGVFEASFLPVGAL
jgi:hypothetical protein